MDFSKTIRELEEELSINGIRRSQLVNAIRILRALSKNKKPVYPSKMLGRRRGTGKIQKQIISVLGEEPDIPISPEGVSRWSVNFGTRLSEQQCDDAMKRLSQYGLIHRVEPGLYTLKKVRHPWGKDSQREAKE